MAGAPEGNTNARRGFRAKQALEIALKIQSGELSLSNVVEGNGMKALVQIWLKQLTKSIDEGDNGSASMIVDRLDGKPMQAVESSGPDGGPIDNKWTVEFINASPTNE